MNPVKVNSTSIAPIRENGIESVVDWFDRNKLSFYALGWFYVRNQQQVEELFYQSIVRVHKELPRYKGNTSFEIWVTSIFIEQCRKLSNKQDGQAVDEVEDVFHALDHLEADQMEALLLTYGKGFSQEEAASLLGISKVKIKELLFTGVRSVRNQLDSSIYNGCKEYQTKYLDYLEKSMDRPEKIEFEKHIYHCGECQEDLASFQDITLTKLSFAEWLNAVDVPPHFMDDIKMRLMENKKLRQQKNKKRMKLAVLFAGVFTLAAAVGLFTGAFDYAYYGLTEEDEQLRTFLQNDLGQRVKLEAESNGVKVKITGVVADEVQTLVFYKIEDLNENNQYFTMYEEGITVENESDILEYYTTHPRYYLPDLKAEMNKKEKNVFYGKAGLRPLLKDKEKGTMTLTITKLLKLNPDPSMPEGFRYDNMDYKTGEWKFEVPVAKQPSTEYALDGQTEIEGIPVRFDKLTVAPTTTIIQFGTSVKQPEKRIDYVNLKDLEVNDKKVKVDLFGHAYGNPVGDIDWNTHHVFFDSLYGEKPNEVAVQFASAQLTSQENKIVELDVNKPFPQTFEYAGSTVSIDKIEVGSPTSIVISDPADANRAYDSFQLNIIGESEYDIFNIEMDMDGVLVDRKGIEYDQETYRFSLAKEQPRHLVTIQNIRLQGDNVIPKGLQITGYNTMKYLDQVVKMKVE